MTEKSVTVGASVETRPAAMFVQAAGKFESHIELIVGERTVNAKSIMGVLALGLLDGETATVRASGADEAAAATALAEILAGGL